MRVLLVALVLMLAAGGTFLAARRGEGGVELRYRVSFPANFAGDRKAAGLEIVRCLGTRLENRRHYWMAFVDKVGMITFRIAGARLDQVPELRRILEAEGRFEAYEIAAPEVRAYYEETGEVPHGYREMPMTEPLPQLNSWHRVDPGVCLVREAPVFGSEILIPLKGRYSPFRYEGEPVLLLDLEMKSAARYALEKASPGAKELLIVIEGKPRSITPIDYVGLDGFLWVPGVKDGAEAVELEAILSAGRQPRPLGEPEIGVFRGKLR